MHAGDLSTLAVLRELEAYGPVVAVHGNVDDPRGPGGAAGGRVDRGRWRDDRPRPRRRPGEGAAAPGCAAGSPSADAVVFGHSHIPRHESRPDGFQIFNPGSPTERRRAPAHTMGMATVVRTGG